VSDRVCLQSRGECAYSSRDW